MIGHGIYRVHVVVTYLAGHHIFERAKEKAGQYWRGDDLNATHWEVVIAAGVEEACAAVRRKHEGPNLKIKRIFSLNHIGDVTLIA